MVDDIKSIKWNDQEIAYSTKVQKAMALELAKANKLRILLILTLTILVIMAALIIFNTGTVGFLARRAICA